MIKRVRCFDEDIDSHRIHLLIDNGIRVVEVDQIVGTVGKCGELDKNFRYISRKDLGEKNRWDQLYELMRGYHYFAPINVYLFNGVYYIMDGNRRVAAAKKIGIEFIDAHVVEYIYKNDRDAMNAALTRKKFQSQTNLQYITLKYESGFNVLLEAIKEYPKGDQFVEKSHLWYSNFYLPFIKIISQGSLTDEYSNMNSGDIIVLIVSYYIDYLGHIPYDVDFNTLITTFKFAHNISQKRIYRFMPFKWVYGLLTKKIKRVSYNRD